MKVQEQRKVQNLATMFIYIADDINSTSHLLNIINLLCFKMLKISLYDLQRRFWASSWCNCLRNFEIFDFCFLMIFLLLMLGGIVSIMYDFKVPF